MIGKKEIILGLPVHFFLVVSVSLAIGVVVEAADKALSETNQQKNNSSSDITANINNTLSSSSNRSHHENDPASSKNFSHNQTTTEQETTIITKRLSQEENNGAATKDTQLTNAANKATSREIVKSRGWGFGAVKDTFSTLSCRFTNFGCSNNNSDDYEYDDGSTPDNAAGMPDIRLGFKAENGTANSTKTNKTTSKP